MINPFKKKCSVNSLNSSISFTPKKKTPQPLKVKFFESQSQRIILTPVKRRKKIANIKNDDKKPEASFFIPIEKIGLNSSNPFGNILEFSPSILFSKDINNSPKKEIFQNLEFYELVLINEIVKDHLSFQVAPLASSEHSSLNKLSRLNSFNFSKPSQEKSRRTFSISNTQNQNSLMRAIKSGSSLDYLKKCKKKLRIALLHCLHGLENSCFLNNQTVTETLSKNSISKIQEIIHDNNLRNSKELLFCGNYSQSFTVAIFSGKHKFIFYKNYEGNELELLYCGSLADLRSLVFSHARNIENIDRFFDLMGKNNAVKGKENLQFFIEIFTSLFDFGVTEEIRISSDLPFPYGASIPPEFGDQKEIKMIRQGEKVADSKIFNQEVVGRFNLNRILKLVEFCEKNGVLINSIEKKE